MSNYVGREHALVTLCQDLLTASDRHAATALRERQHYGHWMGLSDELRRMSKQVYRVMVQHNCAIPDALIARLSTSLTPQRP